MGLRIVCVAFTVVVLAISAFQPTPGTLSGKVAGGIHGRDPIYSCDPCKKTLVEQVCSVRGLNTDNWTCMLDFNAQQCPGSCAGAYVCNGSATSEVCIGPQLGVVDLCRCTMDGEMACGSKLLFRGACQVLWAPDIENPDQMIPVGCKCGGIKIITDDICNTSALGSYDDNCPGMGITSTEPRGSLLLAVERL